MKEQNELTIPKLIKRYWLFSLFTLVLVFISNGLSLVFPNEIGKFIDNSGSSPYSIWLLAVLAFVILALSIVQLLAASRLSEKIAFDLRHDLMNSLSRQSYRYINETGVGNILTYFTSDIKNLKEFISNGFLFTLQSIIILFGAVIALFTINQQLALVAIITLPLIIISFGVIFSKIGPIFSNMLVNTGVMYTIISETVFGAATVKTLDASSWELEKFSKKNSIGVGYNLEVIKWFSTLLPAINLIVNIAILAILWFGGTQVVSGSLQIGQLAAFITYFNLLVTPIFILGFASQDISRGITSLKRISSVLQEPIEEWTGAYDSEITGRVEVKNVSVTLDKKTVLSNVSFSIAPGTRTAIVGPTSGGKSVLVNSLIGLTPYSGEIYIDGVELHDWKQTRVFTSISMVFQDSVLLNDTIRKNISIQSEYTDEELFKLLHIADLDDFVRAQPNGLDTIVNERGSNLSGGQKQRLMLARALAAQPKILILDDFTARVDTETEKRIWKNLQEFLPGITLISVTQKIEPITDFDSIVVLSQGEVVGNGTHVELLQTCVPYQLICKSQTGIDV